ncbi:MAG: HEPN domain-containing protein [bacterium]
MNDKTVSEWIKYADDDLKAGITLFNNNPDEFKSIVCFHMQQAVEKYLKAYLIFNNKEIDKHKTHDIAKLIEDCNKIDPNFNSLYNNKTDKLTDYAVAIRYPSTLRVISPEDEKTAIFVAQQVKLFVIGKIKI